MIDFFSKIWNKSFKYQLIYGFGFILSVLIIGFSYVNTSNQNAFLQKAAIEQALSRSLALAKTSKVWVMANDYVGLESVVNDVSIYDNLNFAAIINMDGKVIGHTDNTLVGKYVSDAKRVTYIKNLKLHNDEETTIKVLVDNTKYIDVIRVIDDDVGKHLGYVQMRLNQSYHEDIINEMIIKSVIFTLASILIGIAFAYLVANGLIRNLSRLMGSVIRYSQGHRGEVAEENTVEEISKLSHEFNRLTKHLNTAEDLNQKLTERLELAFIGTQDGLWDWNITTDDVYFSPLWKKMLGYEDWELENKFSEWEKNVHPQDLEDAKKEVQNHLSAKTNAYSNVHRLKHKNGSWVWILARGKALYDENKKAIRMVGTHTDITKETEEREAHQHVLEYQAHHDALTKLPNRLLFYDRLSQGIEKAKRHNTHLAVFFIDLDRFKQINDSLGHDIGDKVLQEFSDRLMVITRKEDTLARLGGDEFTILMEDLHRAQDASHLAEKILKSLIDPIEIKGHVLYMSSSIGISLFPEDADDATSLLKYADAAMYKAKDEGRDTYQFYSSEMTKIASKNLLLEVSLRKALENDELEVYYQPQVDGVTDEIIGMEALVRWNHPKDGLVSPGTFIPIAEETGLIVLIDRWVMQTAIKQIVKWYKAGLNPGRLALNLAMRQLQNKKCTETIKSYLRDLECRPQWLALEVTEGQIMTNPEQAIIILQEISQMGIELAVDDFGTGYSSLTYLKRLPIDKLKIDQSFVHDLPFDEEDIGISKAIIALSQALYLDVIAEGVETKEQRDFLVENGCRNIQGYFYSRPIPAHEMEIFLKEKNI